MAHAPCSKAMSQAIPWALHTKERPCPLHNQSNTSYYRIYHVSRVRHEMPSRPPYKPHVAILTKTVRFTVHPDLTLKYARCDPRVPLLPIGQRMRVLVRSPSAGPARLGLCRLPEFYIWSVLCQKRPICAPGCYATLAGLRSLTGV